VFQKDGVFERRRPSGLGPGRQTFPLRDDVAFLGFSRNGISPIPSLIARTGRQPPDRAGPAHPWRGTHRGQTGRARGPIAGALAMPRGFDSKGGRRRVAFTVSKARPRGSTRPSSRYLKGRAFRHVRAKGWAAAGVSGHDFLQCARH